MPTGRTPSSAGEEVSERRQHLVEVALELFNEFGYHATGIDRILRTAGVAKMTLYNHFRSKDELIQATLELRDARFRDDARRQVAERADTPAEGLLVLFDLLAEWFEQDDFNGCMFINATAEYPEHDDPVHLTAAEHKRLFTAFMAELATEAGAADPQELAKQLLFIWEGAITSAHVSGADGVAGRARRMAAALVAEACPPAGAALSDA